MIEIDLLDPDSSQTPTKTEVKEVKEEIDMRKLLRVQVISITGELVEVEI